MFVLALLVLVPVHLLGVKFEGVLVNVLVLVLVLQLVDVF